MVKASPGKREKIEAVSFAVLKNYTANPSKKLNVMSIARDQNVSRAWIYKYLGSTPEKILLSALDVVAPMITEVGAPSRRMEDPRFWLRGFLRSLNRTLTEVETYPEIFRFYFVVSLQRSKLAERLKHHEHLYLESRVVPQIRSAFRSSRSEAKALGTLLIQLRIGLVFAWLTEPHRTPQKRLALLKQVRVTVLDRLAD